MVVGVCQVSLHLPAVTSLKEKRQVIQSVLKRLSNEFNIAAAEVGGQDRWQVAELGFACVSNEASHVDEVLNRAIQFIERTRPDVEITHQEIEVLHL
ncbi:MAG: DUF503 domain-containing protein [Chloroflexi bacterium]|nr:DUF503 domain-containing protein [Chloroflexota bacterium]